MPLRENLYRLSGESPKLGPLDARVVFIVPAIFNGLKPSTLLVFAVWIAIWAYLSLAVDIKTLRRDLRRRIGAGMKSTLHILSPINTRH